MLKEVSITINVPILDRASIVIIPLLCLVPQQSSSPYHTGRCFLSSPTVNFNFLYFPCWKMLIFIH